MILNKLRLQDLLGLFYNPFIVSHIIPINNLLGLFNLSVPIIRTVNSDLQISKCCNQHYFNSTEFQAFLPEDLLADRVCGYDLAKSSKEWVSIFASDALRCLANGHLFFSNLAILYYFAYFLAKDFILNWNVCIPLCSSSQIPLPIIPLYVVVLILHTVLLCNQLFLINYLLLVIFFVQPILFHLIYYSLLLQIFNLFRLI